MEKIKFIFIRTIGNLDLKKEHFEELSNLNIDIF